MGYLEIAGAGVIWASTGPLLKLIQKSGFTPYDIVLLRSLTSTCLIGLYIVLSARVKKFTRTRNDRMSAETACAGTGSEPEDPGLFALDSRDVMNLMFIGFVAVIFSQTTYFYALSKTSVAVAVTLNYTSPFFVMAFSFLLFKEPVTRGKIAALLGAVLGVALASGFLGSESTRLATSVPGVAAGLLSGLGYSLQTIVYKRVGRKYGPIRLNFWTMAFGALELSVILTLMTGRLPDVFTKIAHAPADTRLFFLLIGLGSGTLAFILFADGINKVEATKGSIVAMCEPVAACLLGYFVLGETLVAAQAIGIGLVLASIWAVSIPEARRRKRRLPAVGR